MKKQISYLLLALIFSSLFVAVVLADEIKTTEGIQTSVDANTKATTYTFTKAGDSITLGDHTYWNIQPNSNSDPAYIKVNDKNEITDASFKFNEKGGTYAFGDKLVDVPGNSSVLFKNGVLKISQPSGSSITTPQDIKGSTSKSLSNIIYAGNNLALPNGNTLNSGAIQYSGGKFSISNSFAYEAVINSVSFSNLQSPLPVYFGGSGNLEGVTFNGGSTIINLQNEKYTSDNTPKITFPPYGTNEPVSLHPLDNLYFNYNSQVGTTNIPSATGGGGSG